MQKLDIRVDVAVVGAGTAGGNALREIRNAGKSFVLIDSGPLGTTCARVGCMPSKAVLHAASVWQGYASLAGRNGAPESASPNSLWAAARSTRDMLAAGAASRTMAAAGENLVMGRARFLAPDLLEVDGRRIQAGAFVIATGSRPVVPEFLHDMQDRVVTTDSLFEMNTLPRSIGILGLGAIGLEIGLALSRLGVRVVAGDMKTTPAGIADPELAIRAVDYFRRADSLKMWLGRPLTAARSAEGVVISNGEETEEVDCILAALGRKPALEGLRLDLAGIPLDQYGQPLVDPHTMCAGTSNVYFAGDVVTGRPLQHEAADEGSIAGWNAAHHGAAISFARKVPLAIVFSDPDIAFVGQAFDHLDAGKILIGTGQGKANGRSRVMGAEDNLVRIYANRDDGVLLGASIFATRGEHIAHLLALAIQRGETAAGLLRMPFYHPTVEEMVQSALADIVRQQGGTPSLPLGLLPLCQQP